VGDSVKAQRKLVDCGVGQVFLQFRKC